MNLLFHDAHYIFLKGILGEMIPLINLKIFIMKLLIS